MLADIIISDFAIATSLSLEMALGLAIAAALALFLPGFLLTSVLFDRNALSGAARVAVSIVLSMSLSIVFATIVLALKWPLGALFWLIVGFNLTFTVSSVVLQRPRDHRTSNGQSIAKANRLLLGVFGVVAALSLFGLTLPIGRINPENDFWVYVGYVRKWATFGQRPQVHLFVGTDIKVGDFRMIFGGWTLVQALLSVLSKIDPIDLAGWFVPSLLLITAGIGFYAFAETLFRSRNAAILASLAQMVFLLSSTGERDGMGRFFFERINEDKFLLTFVLLPVMVLFMIRFLRSKSRADLACLILMVASSACTHPLGLVFGGLSIGFLAPLHLLFDRRREVILRLGLTFGVLAVFLPIPLIQTFIFSSDDLQVEWYPTSIDTAEGQAQAQGGLYSPRILVMDASRNRYMVNPKTLESPIIIAALLLTPFLLLYVRKHLAARFLLSNMVGLMLILFNPFLTPLLGRIVTPWLTYRILWILPCSLVVGFFLDRVMNWAENGISGSMLARIPGLSGVLVAFVLLGSAFLLAGSDKRGWPEVGRPLDIEYKSELDLLLHARNLISEPTSVMCEHKSEIGFMLPAVLQYGFVPTWRSRQMLKTSRTDVLALYNTQSLDTTSWDILHRNASKYVIANNDQALPFLSSYPLLSPVYANDRYVLFKVTAINAETVDGSAMDGAWAALEGNWDRSIEEYTEAIGTNPNDQWLYAARARAYQKAGDTGNAGQDYARFLALSPDPSTIVGVLAAGLNVDPTYALAYAAAGEAYETTPDVDVAIDLLSHLKDANAFSSESNDPARRSAVVIDKLPKGIIVQSAPSQATFDLEIPANAELDFALALMPDVWRLGMGDGVQFQIELRTRSGVVSQVFSEYIDPKNVLADRRWHGRRVDLSAWAEQTATLTLDAGPGPNGDSRFDWAVWGEPRIVQPIDSGSLE